jgi:hypothetical protein
MSSSPESFMSKDNGLAEVQSKAILLYTADKGNDMTKRNGT